jgi:hypothetical protein
MPRRNEMTFLLVSANKNIAAILSKAAKDSKSSTAKKAKEDK